MEDILEIIIGRGGVDHNLIRGIILNDIFGEDQEPVNQDENIHRFNLDEIEPEEVKKNFRFRKDDLPRLCQAFRIPTPIITRSGHKATDIEGLCILLRRLAYPNRLCDLQHIFHKSSAALSEIINFVNAHIVTTFGHLLDNLNNFDWLNQDRLQQYANAIATKGALIQNCWGFIDGTVRPICRPSLQQEDYYSGHKKTHCVKYQGVVTPDGIIVSQMGAFQGRRHDAGIFRESGLYNQLEAKTRFNNNHFVLFGDQAYGIRELLLCPYPGRGGNEQQHLFNASMSRVRMAVEWTFGKIIGEFAFLDFKKNQKLLLQDIEAMYRTATILINCHGCLYRNQTSLYFNVEPIPLEVYLNN